MRRLLTVVLVAAALTACGDDDEPDSPAASVTTTAEDEVLAEVEAAYLRFWEVYAKALRTFDETSLDEVLMDRALETTRAELARLRAANTPVRASAEHSYDIDVQGATASVSDRMINHAVLLNPTTGEPTEPDPNDKLHFVYTLKEVAGTWRVAEIERRS